MHLGIIEAEVNFLRRYSNEDLTMRARVDDAVLVAAYTSFRAESGASADSSLVNPTLRNRFLSVVRRQVGDVEEEPVLRRLLNLRKRSRLPHC
jgi:hypothetical protein